MITCLLSIRNQVDIPHGILFLKVICSNKYTR
ncbi:MPPV-022 ankyrin repeat protein [Magpiepox virus 2]|nr:MPPV-022 ankyrin repeat protein [Magpiepox virus 2]